jgi:NADPH2:quinone reductase
MIDEALTELFTLAAAGDLRVVVGGTYSLADEPQAQVDLQQRRTTG